MKSCPPSPGQPSPVRIPGGRAYIALKASDPVSRARLIPGLGLGSCPTLMSTLDLPSHRIL
jgi:hypothetical protein